MMLFHQVSSPHLRPCFAGAGAPLGGARRRGVGVGTSRAAGGSEELVSVGLEVMPCCARATAARVRPAHRARSPRH